MTEPGPELPSGAPPRLEVVRALLVTSLVLLGGPAVWMALEGEPSVGLALCFAALPYAIVLLALRGQSVVGPLGAARILACWAAVFIVLAIAIPSLL